MTYLNFFLSLVLLLPLLGTGCSSSKENLVPVQSMCQRAKRLNGYRAVPVPCSGKDQDKDGIDDAADHCPKHPETANNEFDLDGCPDPDADQDFVLDYQDACPQVAGLEPDGCPFSDADQDGIADHLDSCPNHREDYDGEFDQDGCPEGLQTYASTIEGISVLRAEEYFFEKSSSKMSAENTERLQEIGDSLLGQESQLARVQLDIYVSVHEREKKDARIQLAQKRARPITNKLQEVGIPNEIIVQNYFEIDEKSQKGARIELAIFVKDKPAKL